MSVGVGPPAVDAAVQIGAVELFDTQKRVEVGQEVQRVAREVGKAVVFQCVNVGGEVVGRGRTVERDTQTREVQRVDGGLARRRFEAVEALEQPAVGIVGVSDQQELRGTGSRIFGEPYGSSSCMVMPESVELCE